MDIQHFLALPVGLHVTRVAVSHLIAHRFFARVPEDALPACPPGVTLIRPLLGRDPFDLDNHRSLLELDYPGPYEILFCAETADDPSLEAVRSLREDYANVDVRIVISDGVDAAGLMKNVIAGARAARYEVVIFSDSDVRLGQSFLRRTVERLSDPRVGLVFCVPLVEGAQGWAATMFGSAVNDTAAPVTALSKVGLYHEAIGATMAMRRDVLDEIGGLEPFSEMITHDVPLARAVFRRGYRVRVLGEPASMFHPHDRFGRLYRHLLRWLTIIRAYHPVAIGMLIPFDLPFYWALLYLIASAVGGLSVAPALSLLVLALVTRPISTVVIEGVLAGRRPRWRFFWARSALEVLRLPLLLQALVTREFDWRGRRFRIGRGGRILTLGV